MHTEKHINYSLQKSQPKNLHICATVVTFNLIRPATLPARSAHPGRFSIFIPLPLQNRIAHAV